MEKTGKGIVPVYIIAITLLFNGIFASEIIFHTLPQDQIDNNLKKSMEWKLPENQWQSLNGSWQLINSNTGETVGDVNIPFSFSGSQSLLIRKLFNIPDVSHSSIFLNFDWINGNIEIKINHRLLYRGSRNFLPLRLKIPNQILQSGENTISVNIKPYCEERGQNPGWNPINQPRIDSGILSSGYIEILPKFYIESFDMQVSITDSTPSFRGFVKLNQHISLTENPKINISYFSSEEKLYQETIIFEDSLQTDIEFPEWRGNGLHLWSFDKPMNYWIEVSLDTGNTSLHVLRKKVAVRNASIKENRMFLNSKAIYINGINYVYQNPKGHTLFNPQLIQKDLAWIKSKGFNSIRVIMNPLPVDFYRICDELGLLCFQDLPVNLFNRSNDSANTFLENWNSYYDYLNQLSTQFSSVSGIGINFQLDGASNRHFDLLNNFQSIIKKSTIPKYIIILNHHPELHHTADFQIIEIAKRNELQEQLNFIRQNFPEYANFPSGYTKAVSYRIDSTLFKDDLSQITEFYETVKSELEEDKLFGHFTTTYSDFFLQFPSLQNNMHKNPFLNKTGLVNLKRQPRQFTGITNSNSETKPLTTVKENNQSYLYIILGLLNLFLFLFFYRQFLEFRLNIHYSLKKTHGFFINLQERIQIPNGQSFLLLFVVSLNCAIMWSALTYYYRNNLFFDYLISLIFFAPELKLWIIKTIWNPASFLIVGTVFGFIIFLFFAFILKIFSLFGKTRVQVRQAIAVSAWSAVPLVILTPFAIIFYNILITFKSFWIMLGVLLYFYLWSYIRWINGIRVLTDRLFVRTFMLFTLLFLACTSIIFLYFQYKINIIEHLKFIFHLYSN